LINFEKANTLKPSRNKENRMGFVTELWHFFKERKKWWLLPMIVILLLFGMLIVLTGGSALAPFLYTLF
jgi:hypothetical protein